MDDSDDPIGHLRRLTENKLERMTELDDTFEVERELQDKIVSPVRLKWATLEGDTLIAHMARVSNSKALPGDPSERLIGYLIRNHHWSPFEMVNMCLEIDTTRDISAQILRHRSFTFQEFSTRYAEVETLMWPIECRFQDAKNRQSSRTMTEVLVDGTTEEQTEVEATMSYFDAVVNEAAQRAMEGYEELLRLGVAKEVARRILPIGLIPTKMYMNGNVRSWLHYVAERTQDGVQKEHRDIAMLALKVLAQNFPDTIRAAAAAGIFSLSDDNATLLGGWLL